MRIIGMFLAFFACQGGAFAQGWAEKMFREGLAHNFGTVPRGAQLVHKFPVTNIYSVPMEIMTVVPGCSCISFTIPKRTLEPRETVTVDIRMDASRFVGPKTVGIRISVGPEFLSSAEIRVSAVSRADVVFNPGEINLGTVAAGAQPTAKIEVEYAGTFNWSLLELTVGTLPVLATFKELYRRPGQVGYEITVTLKPDAPQGTIKDFIYLKTNDTQTPIVPLLILGGIASELSLTPPILSLVDVKMAEPLTRRVVIRGTRPFSISRVESADPDIQSTTPLPTGEGLTQTLAFSIRPSRVGPLRQEVKIQTSISQKPLVLLLDGTVLP